MLGDLGRTSEHRILFFGKFCTGHVPPKTGENGRKIRKKKFKKGTKIVKITFWVHMQAMNEMETFPFVVL